MKKTSVTIEDLRHVNIPVMINDIPHTIIGLKMLGTSIIQDALGVDDRKWFIEIINENTNESDILRPFLEWVRVQGTTPRPAWERLETYNTCVRAINRWIQKELTKEV